MQWKSPAPKSLKDIKMIASDMDGTFFGRGLRIPSDALETYKKATTSGLTIVPTTGRSLEGVRRVLERNKISSEVKVFPGIYLNGAVVYGPGGEEDIIMKCELSFDTVETTYTFVSKFNTQALSQKIWEGMSNEENSVSRHGFSSLFDPSLKQCCACLGIYTGENMVFEEENQLTDWAKQLNESEYKYVADILSYLKDKSVFKLLLFTRSSDISRELETSLNKLLGLRKIEITTGIPGILEISAAGVNKLEGIKKLIKRLGYQMSQVCSIGDGENDVEMIEHCGYSFAMSNCVKQLRPLATEITGDVDDGGWADAVSKVLDAKNS